MKSQSKAFTLALIATATLSACGGSGGDSTPIEPSKLAREVAVSFNTIEMTEEYVANNGDVMALQVDSREYTHYMHVQGYSMCMTDERNIAPVCSTISITDPDTQVAFNVLGDAVFTVDSTHLNPYGYSVSGTTISVADETEIQMTLSNEKWAFITVDGHELITQQMSPKVNDTPTAYKSENDFYYIYKEQGISADVAIELNTGDILTDTIANLEANKHYAYVVKAVAPDPTHDTNVGFDIIDKWENAQEICIGECVLPVLPLEQIKRATDLVMNEDGSISGMTAGKSVYASIEMDATAEPMAIEDVVFNFNVEFPSAQFVNVYLTNINGENVRVNMYTDTLWTDVQAEYAGATIRNDYIEFGVGGFLKSNNFVLRLGDSTYAETEAFTIHELSIGM